MLSGTQGKPLSRQAEHQTALHSTQALPADPGRNRGLPICLHTPPPNGEEAKATTTQDGRRIANCSPDPELMEAMACHRTDHTPHALGLILEPLQYRAHTQHTRKNKPRSPTQA